MHDVHQDLARPADVADHLGTTVGRLANLRYRGEGPAFVRLGRSIRYRWSDVEAWVNAHVQNAGR